VFFFSKRKPIYNSRESNNKRNYESMWRIKGKKIASMLYLSRKKE